ncbi:MAG: membrane dipeptidase [Gemmatimonadota bacterium]|nr:membrane dipeptidase [Gemmatimonadota bacterium]
MPPPPPFAISTVTPSASAVNLVWQRAPRANRYRIFRDNNWLADNEATAQRAPDTTYQDKTVKPNTSYTYRIDAEFDALYMGGKSYPPGPVATVSATATTKAPYPAVEGFADTHTHPFANLASGGRMFWGAAFGPMQAVLSLCATWHGHGGLNDVVGNLKQGNFLGHQTGGYPDFAGWPSWATLTHQGMHADWIRRAHQGGLRLMVALAVNNALVCEAAAKAPGRTCGDMEAADLQIDAAKQMENYIDMQSGGLGKGWFRIAYTPEQARQIINDGKLAVVLGIEVDKLFGCAKGECDANLVDTELAKYYALGVRHLFPVHLADNAFGGFALTGSDLFKLNSNSANPGGITGPGVVDEDCSARGFAKKCNSRGLTTLGAHLIRSMMNKGMIIDIDHMGMHTTDGVLALTSPRGYPVVGGHTGFVGTTVPGESTEREKSNGWLDTMKSTGGMVSVGLAGEKALSYTPSWRGAVPNNCDATTKTVAQSYLFAVDRMGGPDSAAIGLATDQFLNPMTAPRFGNPHCPGETPATRVAYPITTRAGLTLQASTAGNRTFNYNEDGLAHFGLLPDLIQDLKNDGLTDRDLAPLFRSAEGYIRVWERAVASVPVP